MEFNFKKDLEIEIKRIIRSYGYQVPTSVQLRGQDKRDPKLISKIQDYDLENLLWHFFTVCGRRIEQKKWNVYVSKELKVKPEFQLIQGIVKKLKSGDNVNDLISNKVRRLNQRKDANTDLLLYEWGIFHLHLSPGRSDELLLVYFTEDSALLIDILMHENKKVGNVTWTNTNLIQIIHDNWPEAISIFRYQENSETQQITIEQRRTLRQKAANTTVVLSDGTEYLPPEWGFTFSKHTVKSIIQSDMILDYVEYIEAVIKENEEVIRSAISKRNGDIAFELKLNEKLQPVVYEKTTNTLLSLQIEIKEP